MEKRKREEERSVMDMMLLCVECHFWTKFHITSTHPVINADHELGKKFTDPLFQLNTVREHDNHEVI